MGELHGMASLEAVAARTAISNALIYLRPKANAPTGSNADWDRDQANSALEALASCEVPDGLAAAFGNESIELYKSMRKAHDIVDMAFATPTSAGGRGAIRVVNDLRVAMAAMKHGIEATASRLPIQPVVREEESPRSDDPAVRGLRILVNGQGQYSLYSGDAQTCFGRGLTATQRDEVLFALQTRPEALSDEVLTQAKLEARIRADVIRFHTLLMAAIPVPEKHAWHAADGLLTFGGGPVSATQHGVSFFVGKQWGNETSADDRTADPAQIAVEVRLFLPERKYTSGFRVQPYRKFSGDSYSAHLWVQSGPQWAGKSFEHVADAEKYPKADSIENLVKQIAPVVTQAMRDGMAMRMPPRHKIGDTVCPNGMHATGEIFSEDTDNPQSPHLFGEKLWFIRFDDGTEGGGWRDGALRSLVVRDGDRVSDAVATLKAIREMGQTSDSSQARSMADMASTALAKLEPGDGAPVHRSLSEAAPDDVPTARQRLRM